MAARFSALFSLVAAVCLIPFAFPVVARAQQKPNVVKGHAQIAGGNGEFGTIYSIGTMNLQILSAHYSIDPYVCSSPQSAKVGTKMLILNIAVKNSSDSNQPFYYPYDLFTLVDSTGQLYGGPTLQLASAGVKDFSTMLRPGQGMGQPALHNPLTECFHVPGNARIVKIMINHGRFGRNEEGFRYYIAGATKEEAGEAGNPKNRIDPLPLAARDPADPSGATLLDVAKASLGTYMPSGFFLIKVDSFVYSTDAIYYGKPPAAGKKFAIMTVTAKCDVDNRSSTFDLEGGDFPLWSIETTDGDRLKPDGYRKATTDVAPEHKFEPGDEYTIRIFWILDKNAMVKRAIVAAGNSNKWGLDGSLIH